MHITLVPVEYAVEEDGKRVAGRILGSSKVFKKASNGAHWRMEGNEAVAWLHVSESITAGEIAVFVDLTKITDDLLRGHVSPNDVSISFRDADAEHLPKLVLKVTNLSSYLLCGKVTIVNVSDE
ncbi:MAG: hypothetical protein Q7S16_03095 [bacterium]|nr:hypothetical protein [bacterium]